MSNYTIINIREDWIVGETLIKRIESDHELIYVGIAANGRIVFEDSSDEFLLVGLDELNKLGEYLILPASLDKIKVQKQEKIIHSQSSIIRVLKKALLYYSIEPDKSKKIVNKIEQLESKSLLEYYEN